MGQELDIYTATLDEFVFENRNKNYGGYFLRVWYDRNIAKATLISCVLFIWTMLGVYAYYNMTSKPKAAFVPVIIEMKVSEEPLKEDELKKLPPPPQLEKPKIEMIKFVPPEIKPDKEVQVEEQLQEQDKIVESNPGDKDQDGEKLQASDYDAGSTAGVAGGTGTDEVQIYSYVGEMPKFKGGGDEEVTKYIHNHLMTDRIVKKVDATIWVEFVISPTGEVKDVKVIKGKGVNSSLDEEAVRVIKSMPKWEPGKNNGTPVSVKKHIPIKFKVNE
ncbi:MAG: TonB family protein [Cytophagales bacterium]|nr:TonB family protein [Cytophaga sp.]